MQYHGDSTSTTTTASNPSGSSSTTSYTTSDEDDGDIPLVVDNSDIVPEGPPRPQTRAAATTSIGSQRLGKRMFNDDDDSSDADASEDAPTGAASYYRDPTVNELAATHAQYGRVNEVEECGEDALSMHFFQRRQRVMGGGPAGFEEKDGRPATRGEAGMLNNEDDFADYAMRADYDSDLDASSSPSSDVPSHPTRHQPIIGGYQSATGSGSVYSNEDGVDSDQPVPARRGMHQSRMWSELLLLNTENGQPLDQSVHCLQASKYVSDYVAIPTAASREEGGGDSGKSTMQMRVLTTPFLPSNAHLPFSFEAQSAGALDEVDDEDRHIPSTRRPLSATNDHNDTTCSTPILSPCTQERLLQLLSLKLQRIGENPFSSSTSTAQSSSTLSHFIFSGAAIDDDYRLIAQYEANSTPTPATISLGAVIGMSSVHRHRTTLFAPGEAARATFPSAALSLGGSSSVVPTTMTAQEATSIVYLLASSLSTTSSTSGGYVPHGNMTPSTIRLTVPGGSDHREEPGVRIVLDDPLHYGFHYPFTGSSVPCANTNVSHVPVAYLEYLNHHVILPTLKKEGNVDGGGDTTLQQQLFLRYEELQNSSSSGPHIHEEDCDTEVGSRGYTVTELDDVHALVDVLFQCLVGHSWFHGQCLMDLCRGLHTSGSSDAWVESVWSVVDSILNTVAFARPTPTLNNFKISSFQQSLPPPRMEDVKDVFKQVILDGTITTIKELLAHPIFECIGGDNKNSNEEKVREMAQFNVAGVVSKSALDCRGFLLQQCMNGGGGGQSNNPIAIEDVDLQSPNIENAEQSPSDTLAAKGPYCFQHPMLQPLLANITNRVSSHTLHRLHTAHLHIKKKKAQKDPHATDQIRRALRMLISPSSPSVDAVVVWCRPTIQHALDLLQTYHNHRDTDSSSNDPIVYLESVAQYVCSGTGNSPSLWDLYSSKIFVDHTTSTITIKGHPSYRNDEEEGSNREGASRGVLHSQRIEIDAVRLGIISYLFYIKDLFSTVMSAVALSDADIEDVHWKVLQEHRDPDHHHHRTATTTTSSHVGAVSLPGESSSVEGVNNVEFEDDDVETERNKALVKALMRKSKVSTEEGVSAPPKVQHGERESSPPVTEPSKTTTLPVTIKAVRQRLLSYVQWASFQPPPPVPTNLLVTNAHRLLLNITTSFHTISVFDVSNSRLLLGVTSSSSSATDSDGAGHMSSPLVGVCHLNNISDCDLVAVASRQLVLHGKMTNTLVSSLLVDNPICVGKATFQHQQQPDDDEPHHNPSPSHPQLSFLAGEALLYDVQFIPYCITFQGLSLITSAKGHSAMGVMLPEYVSSALSFPVQGSRRLPFQRMLTDVTIDESSMLMHVDIPQRAQMGIMCQPYVPRSKAALLAHYFGADSTTSKPSHINGNTNQFIDMLTRCLVPPPDASTAGPPSTVGVVDGYALPDAFLLPVASALSSGPYLHGNNNTASITILPGEITPGCSGVILHDIHGGLTLHSSSRLEQQRRRNKRRERRIARRRVKFMGGGGGARGGGGLGFCAPTSTEAGGFLSPLCNSPNDPATLNEWRGRSTPQRKLGQHVAMLDGVGECDPADAIAEGLIAALHGISVAELYDQGSQNKRNKPGCSGSGGSGCKAGGSSSCTTPGIFTDKGMINFLDTPCNTGAAGDKDELPDSSTPTTDTDDENDLESVGKSTRGSMQRRASIPVSVANSAVTDFDDGLDDDLSGDDDDDEDSGDFWGTDGGGGMGSLLQRQSQSSFEPPLEHGGGAQHNTATSGGGFNNSGSSQSLRGGARRKSGNSQRGTGGLPSRRSNKAGKISKSASQQHLLQQQQIVHLKRKDTYSYSTPCLVILEAVPYVLIENVSRATIVICGVGAGGVTIRACSHCTVFIVSMGGAITIEGGHHLDLHAYVMGPRIHTHTTGNAPLASKLSAPIVFRPGRACTQGDISDALHNNMASPQRCGIPEGTKLPYCDMSSAVTTRSFPTNVHVHPLILEAPQLETILLEAMTTSSLSVTNNNLNADNNDDLLGSFLHDYMNRVLCPRPFEGDCSGVDLKDEDDGKPFDHIDNDIALVTASPQCIYELTVPYLVTPTSVSDYFLQQHDIGILEQSDREVAAAAGGGGAATASTRNQRTEDLPRKPITYVIDAATEERLQRYILGWRGVVNLRDEQLVSGGSHKGETLSRREGECAFNSGAAGSMNGFSMDYPLIPPTFSASNSPTIGMSPQDFKNGAVPPFLDKYRLSGGGDEDAVRVGSEDDDHSSRRLTPPYINATAPSLYLPFHVFPQQTITICNLSDCSILRVGSKGLSPIVSPPPFLRYSTKNDADAALGASRNNAQPAPGSPLAEFNPIIPFLGGDDDFDAGGMSQYITTNSKRQQQHLAMTTTQRLVISNIAGGVIHVSAAVETLVVSNCVGPLDIVVTAAKTVVIENCTGVTLQCACFEIALFSCTFCHLALHTNCAPRLFNSVDVSEAAVLLPPRSQFALGGPIASPTFDCGDGSGWMGSGSASGGPLLEASSGTMPKHSGGRSPLPTPGGGGNGSGGGRCVTVEGESSHNRFSALHIACTGLSSMMEELGIDVDVNLYDEVVWTSSSSSSSSPINYFRYSISVDSNPLYDCGTSLPTTNSSTSRSQQVTRTRQSHRYTEDEDDCVSEAAGLLRDGCPIHDGSGEACTMYCVSALLAATKTTQRDYHEVIDDKCRADLRATISALDFPVWLRPLLLTLSASSTPASVTSKHTSPLLPLASLHLCGYLMTQLLSDYPHWVIAPPLHCTVVGDDTAEDDGTHMFHNQYADDRDGNASNGLRPPAFLARRVYYEVGTGLYEAVGGSSAMNFDPHTSIMRHQFSGDSNAAGGSPSIEPTSRRFSSVIPKSRREEEEVQRIVDDVLAGGSIFLSRSDISSTLMELTQSTIQQTQQQRSASGGSGVGGMSSPPSGALRKSLFRADSDDDISPSSSPNDSLDSSMSCTSMSLSRRRRSEFRSCNNNDKSRAYGESRRVTLRDAVYEQLPRVKALIKFIALIRVVVDVCEEEISDTAAHEDLNDNKEDRTSHLHLSITDTMYATLKSNWKGIVSLAQRVEAMIEEPVDELNIIRQRLWALEQRFGVPSSSTKSTLASSSLLPARSIAQLLVEQDARESHQRQLKQAADRLLKFSLDADSTREKKAALSASPNGSIAPKVPTVVTSPTSLTTSTPLTTNRYGGNVTSSSPSSPTSNTIVVACSSQMMDDIESVSSGGSSSDEFAPMTPLNAVIAAAVAAREAAAAAAATSSTSQAHDDDDVVLIDGDVDGEGTCIPVPQASNDTTHIVVVNSGNAMEDEAAEDGNDKDALKQRTSVRRPRRAPVVDSSSSSSSSLSSSLSEDGLPLMAATPNKHPHMHTAPQFGISVHEDNEDHTGEDAPLPRSPNGNLSKTFGPDTEDGTYDEEDPAPTTPLRLNEGKNSDDDSDAVGTTNTDDQSPNWATMTLPKTISTAIIESIHSHFEANKARMKELAEEESVVLRRLTTWRNKNNTAQ